MSNSKSDWRTHAKTFIKIVIMVARHGAVGKKLGFKDGDDIESDSVVMKFWNGQI